MPGLPEWLLTVTWAFSPAPLGGQGITPMMRAPMNANAAQTIKALMGRVSPMVSLLYRPSRDSRPE
jgi:hypothetical protein